MMQAQDRCRVCGGALARRAASEGLCPACLLGEALSSEGDRSPYRIVTVIGRDPSGVTYLADTTTGPPRRVAVKIVSPRSDAGMILERYHHWRGAMDALRHPAIRRLLDAGPAGPDQVYLASEYVFGATLAELLARAPLTAAERLAVATHVSEAVAEAHAGGVVHGALDSSHVRVAWGAVPPVKVFGFGTSLIVDGLEPSPAEDLRALDVLLRELEHGA